MRRDGHQHPTHRSASVVCCLFLQAAVGSHRLEVASLVAALLGAGSVVLDEAVACSGALPRLVHLCFAHPACNALHAALLRLLQCAPLRTLPLLCHYSASWPKTSAFCGCWQNK